jgi:hypothetical protein
VDAGPPLPAPQRAAGNRAVVQRLAFGAGKLVVPHSYGDRTMAWSKPLGYVEEREPASTDKTFAQRVKKLKYDDGGSRMKIMSE